MLDTLEQTAQITEGQREKASGLTGFIETLKQDVQVVFDRDPAARSVLEVVLNYPGLHAIWGHRITHWLWKREFKLLGRWLSQVMRFFTGIEIHPGAQIGQGFFIDHGMGVVIGETAEIGDNVTLYHGVTLGGTSLEKGKRHPTLEEGVVVGAGAKILGPFTVGSCSRIGANAVVVKPVPANSVVVGVPGQALQKNKPRYRPDHPELDHTLLPDLIGVTLQSLVTRVEELEKQTRNGRQKEIMPSPFVYDKEVWHSGDYSI